MANPFWLLKIEIRDPFFWIGLYGSSTGTEVDWDEES